MQPILGFYHIAMMNDWLSLVHEQLSKITNANLLDASEYIYASCVGPKHEFNKININYPNIHFNHTSEHINTYEHPTIKIIHETSKLKDFICYYIHTKGVSLINYKDNREAFDSRFNEKHQIKKFGYTTLNKVLKNTYYWRLFLEHFTIMCWEEACEELKKHDCVGASWRLLPFPHYNGNFWWSKASYLRNLEDVYSFTCLTEYDLAVSHYRMRPEAWIGQKRNIKAKKLSNLAPTYFGKPIPPKMYKIKNTHHD